MLDLRIPRLICYLLACVTKIEIEIFNPTASGANKVGMRFGLAPIISAAPNSRQLQHLSNAS